MCVCARDIHILCVILRSYILNLNVYYNFVLRMIIMNVIGDKCLSCDSDLVDDKSWALG